MFCRYAASDRQQYRLTTECFKELIHISVPMRNCWGSVYWLHVRLCRVDHGSTYADLIQSNPVQSNPWVDPIHVNSGSGPVWFAFIFCSKTARRFCDRVLWTLVWLAALAGFLYLLIIKIQQLISHPTNIDVNFKFVDSLPFPAVTVCNLNPYRLVGCPSSVLILHSLPKKLNILAPSCKGKSWSILEVRFRIVLTTICSNFAEYFFYFYWLK